MKLFPFNRHIIFYAVILMTTLLSVTVLLQYFSMFIGNSYASVTPPRGGAGDFWADVEVGKRDFTEISAREVVPYKVNSPGGVVVDQSVSPGRAYVWDSGNNRILGINLATCYGQNSPCTAEIIIGQPSGNDYGACNLDSSFQNYPARAPASASTLCGVAEATKTTLEDKSFSNMHVDPQGNLYVPDTQNHRILKYISPFTTDTIADEVWGQTDFAQNLCNQGSTPAASSLCYSSIGASGMGVTFDAEGNMWVADGGNNRVLRFPQSGGTIAKTADIVLGQPNFTTGGDWSYGNSINKMSGPQSLFFDTGGNLYVADSQNNRVLVFTPPFSNGMNASSTFGSGYQDNSPHSIALDPQRRGIWTFERVNGQAYLRLRDFSGTIIQQLIHGNDGAGSIGFDTDGNILTSTYVYGQDVHRWKFTVPTRDNCSTNDGNVAGCNASPGCGYYFCTNQCWLKGTPNEVACAGLPAEGGYTNDKNLFSPPGGYNLTSNRRLEHPAWVGVAVAANQLVVSDGRLLFWNDTSSLTNGKAADGYVGSASFNTIPDPGYGQLKADGTNRIWVTKKDHVEVYQAPLTTGMTRLASIGPSLTALGGGQITLSDTYGLAVNSQGTVLWVAEPSKHRVMRISNPLTTPVVDIILGQTDLLGNQCNRGLVPAPNTGTSQTASLDMLCYPGALALDRQENLFVSDHYIEAEGNWRLLMFAANTFPATPSQILYAPTATKSFPRASGTNTVGHSTFEPAFDSQNHMVVGINPYLGPRFLTYYLNPTGYNPANPSDPAYALPDGQFNDYYGWAVATAFDSEDNLYAYDANRGKIMIYKHPFPQTPTATLTPTPTVIVPSFTPTPTKSPTPTMTLSPTPSRTPTPTPLPNLLTNGEFELDANGDNLPDTWTTNSKFTRSGVQKHGGSFAGRHYSTSNVDYVIAQTVRVAAGKNYTFTGWTNIPSTSDSFSYKLEVQWKKSSGSTISTTNIKTYSSQTDWNMASKSLTAPSQATQAVIRMNVSSLKATIFADDFVFK